jgi:hypothetical protein
VTTGRRSQQQPRCVGEQRAWLQWRQWDAEEGVGRPWRLIHVPIFLSTAFQLELQITFVDQRKEVCRGDLTDVASSLHISRRRTVY